MVGASTALLRRQSCWRLAGAAPWIVATASAIKLIIAAYAGRPGITMIPCSQGHPATQEIGQKPIAPHYIRVMFVSQWKDALTVLKDCNYGAGTVSFGCGSSEMETGLSTFSIFVTCPLWTVTMYLPESSCCRVCISRCHVSTLCRTSTGRFNETSFLRIYFLPVWADVVSAESHVDKPNPPLIL